ncbi:Fe-S cluster assembly ATP-binding protein SufC [Candidatus Caldarchaeum subterraneum]|uniref:Fe-S cluster assembly ATP-binding protein SufC n=1 Tax=Caldiarchaeum subterraneum TaxID=311458 RepID=E6N306_CALS0|nr:Fe-S cluster assembly ATP-binding protein SufC [Candidatus Caldarchaeum subterraneum]BAJ48363.1 Fe-S cluster assembly ATP-binding protein SufC [Candidatus Caldarchaeum subterraneum]BAJ51143.1 Fe-S cluster assembly ATP-binding protein SufC [Candidatus Caldarchaeum subterraneum]
MELKIVNLHASVEGKQILKGVNLTVREGEIHTLMGPNGSGKSTLAAVIMGHPKYTVDEGDILLDGESIVDLSPDQRARKGLFLAFQYPVEISGVTLANFLRRAYINMKYGGDADKSKISVPEFQKLLKEKIEMLKLDPSIARRYLNEGFSGGEKKRCEVLQMAILSPRIAILDETDSGLDIDGVKIVADGVKTISAATGMGALVITHYQRILNYLKPDVVHVMYGGKVVETGGYELAQLLEEKGYSIIEQKYGPVSG